MQASLRTRVLSSAAVAACAVLSAATPAQAAPVSFESAVTTGSTPYVYYRFNDSAGPAAVATVGASGTYNGTPSFGQTGVGLATDGAVSFDGTNNEYLGASINGFGSLMATSSYEFVFKANPYAATTQQSLFGVFTGASNLPDVEVTLNSNGNDAGAANNVPGNTRLFVRGNNADANGGASIAAHFTNHSLYDGNFHHLVFTYDDAQTGVAAFAAYVDGVRQTLTFTQVNGSVEPAGFGNFDVTAAFAARNVRGTGSDPISREANVTLDEVALYGSVLSPGEVEAHAGAAGFVVPEPGSAALAAVAGLGLLGRRRRQA